jgi:hypothetical protein
MNCSMQPFMHILAKFKIYISIHDSIYDLQKKNSIIPMHILWQIWRVVILLKIIFKFEKHEPKYHRTMEYSELKKIKISKFQPKIL